MLAMIIPVVTGKRPQSISISIGACGGVIADLTNQSSIDLVADELLPLCGAQTVPDVHIYITLPLRPAVRALRCFLSPSSSYTARQHGACCALPGLSPSPQFPYALPIPDLLLGKDVHANCRWLDILLRLPSYHPEVRSNLLIMLLDISLNIV